MDLDKKQKELFKSIKEGSAEAIAGAESMGLSHEFAKLSDKIEVVNLMLVPAMTSTGMVAGEVKHMYSGKGPDNEALKVHLANTVQSVSQLSSIFEISLSEVVEMAFKKTEALGKVKEKE